MLSSEPIHQEHTKEGNNKFGSQLTPDQFKELQDLQSRYFTSYRQVLQQVKQRLGKETLKKSLRAYLASIYANDEAFQSEEENHEPVVIRKRYKRSDNGEGRETSIPATPKFNPDLPETPAVLRRAARLREKQAESIMPGNSQR